MLPRLSFLYFMLKKNGAEQEVTELTGRTIMFFKYFSIPTAYLCIAFTVTHVRPFRFHTCFLKTTQRSGRVIVLRCIITIRFRFYSVQNSIALKYLNL